MARTVLILLQSTIYPWLWVHDLIGKMLKCHTLSMYHLCISLKIYHSLIRGVLIHSCSAGAKNFTNYVFCHPQFSGVIQNIENRCAILILFVNVDYYQNNQFYKVKIEFLKFCFNVTMIFGTLAWTIELYMTK